MATTPDKQTSLLAERNTLRMIIISIGAFGAGLGILYLSRRLEQSINPWASVLADLGGLFVVSVAVSLLWELWGKRSFLDEIWAKAQMTEELRDAGIVAYESDFRLLDWHELLDKASSLDIFFTYSRTWRNQYNRELLEMARRRTTRMRVILPDPEDEVTVRSLAHRFGMGEAELIERINEAKTYFSGLGRMHPAEVEVWFYPRPPLFSFYVIDDKAILALYHHRKERLFVPAFVARGGGELYGYLQAEFEAMIAETGLARKATTP